MQVNLVGSLVGSDDADQLITSLCRCFFVFQDVEQKLSDVLVVDAVPAEVAGPLLAVRSLAKNQRSAEAEPFVLRNQLQQRRARYVEDACVDPAGFQKCVGDFGEQRAEPLSEIVVGVQ